MFYVNGEEVATAKDIGDFPPLNPNPRIGFNNAPVYKIADHGADGVIDEFAIYSEALDSYADGQQAGSRVLLINKPVACSGT